MTGSEKGDKKKGREGKRRRGAGQEQEKKLPKTASVERVSTGEGSTNRKQAK